MLRKFGLERLIPSDKVILLYENGWGLSDMTQDELQRIFGVYKEHISIEQLKEIENNTGTDTGKRLRCLRSSRLQDICGRCCNGQGRIE